MNDFPGPSDDERIRELFDDAVTDVEPRDALDAIHSRTKVKAMNIRRNWLLGAGAAAVATAATIAAVAVMGGSPGTTGAQDQGFAGSESPTASSKPSASSEEPTTSSDPAGKVMTVPVYYVGETSRGPRLYREFHVVKSHDDKPQAALVEAMTGSPDDPDYRTDWPGGALVYFGFDGIGDDGLISISLTTEEVDLHDRPSGMTEQEASLAIEQLIYTAQAATQTRAPVQFMLNGGRTDTVLGVPTSEPLAQGQDFDVLAMVWIIEPAEGAKVQSPFKVSGLANAFEANVQWELMQGDAVVDSGFTTARECCTLAPYSFKVNAPPGDYTLVVHDSDPSGGEGFAPWQDTKNITVTE